MEIYHHLNICKHSVDVSKCIGQSFKMVYMLAWPISTWHAREPAPLPDKWYKGAARGPEVWQAHSRSVELSWRRGLVPHAIYGCLAKTMGRDAARHPFPSGLEWRRHAGLAGPSCTTRIGGVEIRPPDPLEERWCHLHNGEVVHHSHLRHAMPRGSQTRPMPHQAVRCRSVGG